MKMLFGLVFFATGWGPTKGGINSFNFDLCYALGKQSQKRSATIFCICPGTTTECEKEKARDNNVTLIDVDIKDFNNCNFNKIVSDKIEPICEKVFWVGHDAITGEQAFTCRDKYQSILEGKAVLFHHMNYDEYYAIGTPERTAKGEKKVEYQNNIFKNADYAIAVGPKLFKSLEDIRIKINSNVPYMQIIPGLAEIEPIQKEMHNKTILFTGRLEKDNDPIKQYSIPLYAVSDLIKNHDFSLAEIELKLYGLETETREELDKKVDELKSKASTRAGYTVPVKPLSYTSNRDELFREVRNSSIAIMPSISEGFGLVGLESIAAGVPTILSRNSGLYEFLEKQGLNGYVESIDVYGGVNWDSPNEADIKAAYNSFRRILKSYSRYKENALALREKILEFGFTWEKTATEMFEFLHIFEISDLIKELYKLINSKILIKYSDEILLIATTCVDDFAQQVSNELKVDKHSILSLKVDTILEIPYAIISTTLTKKRSAFFWYKQTSIQESVCILLKNYLERVAKKLKSLENTNVLLRNFIVEEIKKEIMDDYKINKSDENYILEDNKFYKKINSIIKNAKIEAVLSEKSKQILKNYHESLKIKYNVLNFEGLSVMVSEGAKNIPLDKIYASLYLVESKQQKSFFEKEENNVSLMEQYDRVIIKGDPGSGKSTYLKKQLLLACDSNKKYMYIFFKVSGYFKWFSENGADSDTKHLADYIKNALLKESECFCDNLLKTYNDLRDIGGVVYFIDGLDEVQDFKQKEIINQQIKLFVDDAKSCKYLLTSRKVGLDEESFKSKNFIITEIAPLSEASIKDYIQKWYKFVGTMPDDTKRDYNLLADKLIKSLENNSQLSYLAGNPLLLSIIVMLHYRGINPPNNRTKLYGEITKTLLETWIARKEFERKYSTEYLTNFFSRIAFEIVTNNYGNMTIMGSRLKEMYTSYANEKNYTMNEEVDNFIQYISDDAGIVTSQGFLNGDNLYGFFMHRQITEYYAAIALEYKLNRKEISFSSIINESKWTEVSILMGGYMSLYGESGEDRVNIFIERLFKTKSKPVEDFKYNILLILKWISNSTFINKNNIELLLSELKSILKSSNSYRVLHFCEDIISSLSNDQCKNQFCKLINDLIDTGDTATIRNISIIINSLIKNKELYENVIEDITEQRIKYILKQLIEDNNNFYMLYRRNGYYHALFMEYFIKCFNQNYKNSVNPNTKTWFDYMGIYASAVCFDNVRYISRIKDLTMLLDKAQGNIEESFNDKDILNEYVHKLVLYVIAFDIAEGSENATSDFEDFCKNAERWNCKELIDSATHLGINIESSINSHYSTYIDSGIRIFHNKDNIGHKLTIFAYNRETKCIDKFYITLGKEFCLDDINNQINEKAIPLFPFNCLDQLSDIEMSQENLEKIFNAVYDRFLLTKNDWHQILLKKMGEDSEVFYKNYDNFKIKIKFDATKNNISKLKGELKTYYKFFAGLREKITISEIKRLILLYKNEDNENHKNVIYDILYDLLHSDSNII